MPLDENWRQCDYTHNKDTEGRAAWRAISFAFLLRMLLFKAFGLQIRKNGEFYIDGK